MKKVISIALLLTITGAFSSDVGKLDFTDQRALKSEVERSLTFSLSKADFMATVRKNGLVMFRRMHDSSGNRLQRMDIYDASGKKRITTLLNIGNDCYQIDDVVGVLKNERPERSAGDLISYTYNTGGMLTNCRNAEYSARIISYEGTPCYLVTVRLRSTAKELARILGGGEEAWEQERDRPALVEYIIGRQVPLMYGVTIYNSNGEKLSTGLKLEQVHLNQKFPDSVFELPKTPEVRTVKNQQDVDRLFEHHTESWNAKIGRWIDRQNENLWEHSGLISWILLGISIGCVGICIGLKVRRKTV